MGRCCTNLKCASPPGSRRCVRKCPVPVKIEEPLCVGLRNCEDETLLIDGNLDVSGCVGVVNKEGTELKVDANVWADIEGCVTLNTCPTDPLLIDGVIVVENGTEPLDVQLEQPLCILSAPACDPRQTIAVERRELNGESEETVSTEIRGSDDATVCISKLCIDQNESSGFYRVQVQQEGQLTLDVGGTEGLASTTFNQLAEILDCVADTSEGRIEWDVREANGCALSLCGADDLVRLSFRASSPEPEKPGPIITGVGCRQPKTCF